MKRIGFKVEGVGEMSLERRADHEGLEKFHASWGEFAHQNIKAIVCPCWWRLHFSTNTVGAQELTIQCFKFDGMLCFLGSLKSCRLLILVDRNLL